MRLLSKAGVRCHISGSVANNFSYADDPAPPVGALNQLIPICERFLVDNYIKDSTSETVCMCILPQRSGIVNLPNIYLASNKLECVESFKYWGHVITRNFSDDEDIKN